MLQFREHKRAKFDSFESRRKENIKVAEEGISKPDYELLKFEELASTINDEYAIKFRCKLLCQYEFPKLKKLLPRYEKLND